MEETEIGGEVGMYQFCHQLQKHEEGVGEVVV